MANIGTVTVEVTPVLPKDATEQIETAVRAAIVEALRNLADGLAATPDTAVKADDEIRVGDTVEYVGTDTPEWQGRQGVVRHVENVTNGWLSVTAPKWGGGYARNFRKV